MNMKHKIKVIVFFLFILCVLAMGVREVNYNNYQIIKNGTREVLMISTDRQRTHIKIFGENIVLSDNINSAIYNMLDKLK